MKKVVLTSVRFRKKLAELSTKGYTFMEELKVCDKNVYFADKDKQFFKDMGVDEYLKYPIREIGLYFTSESEGTMCLVLLEAFEGKLGKMSTSIGGIVSELDSGEKYYIDYGDDIPEEGIEGEPVDTFELRTDTPIFIGELISDGLIREEDTSVEFAEEFALEQVMTAEPPKEMYSWKYKSFMLNNDVHEALFRFRDLNLDELLSDLRKDGYKLISLGLIDVRSLVDSITVCAFKNSKGYSYVSFYYGIEEEEFMVKIQSRETELNRIKVNGKYVPLVSVTVQNADETSTLIHGFDFENFKEYNLAF